MNILILTTHLNPGGVSRYVINLAKGLEKEGNKIFVASSSGEWVGKLELLGIEHKKIPIDTKSFISPKVLFSFFSLLSFVKKNRIEIIHSNTRVTQALGYLFYKFFKIPYISTYHGFYKKSFLRKIIQFSGVKTIAVSKAVKNHLIKDLGIKEDKISVIYNGIDKSDFKDEPKIIIGDLVIGILGRISKEKGHFLAIEAMKLLIKDYPKLFLIICGKGKLEEKLRSEIVKLDLSNRIVFASFPVDEILNYIDILLVPSEKEGFGYAVVEGFIKKSAVIGFNVGGISEIIQDGVNGILFYDYTKEALALAMKRLIENKELKEKIIKQALIDSNYYLLERMAKETKEVYLSVTRN